MGGILLGALGRYWPALVGLVVVLGAYQAGVNAERKRGEAATLRIEIQTMRRDKEIADRTLIRVAEDVAELDAARRANEEEINALQGIIDGRADSGLTQPELDGLLDIR